MTLIGRVANELSNYEVERQFAQLIIYSIKFPNPKHMLMIADCAATAYQSPQIQ